MIDISISRLNMFKGILEVVEKQSKCTRLKVAALLVKDNRIISTGYNGLVSGDDDSICLERCPGCEQTVHAEMNAILFAAKEGIPTKGSTLITSYSPCINCAKHIINAGIEKIIFLRYYRDIEGVDKLLKTNVEVYHFQEGKLIKLRRF